MTKSYSYGHVYYTLEKKQFGNIQTFIIIESIVCSQGLQDNNIETETYSNSPTSLVSHTQIDTPLATEANIFAKASSRFIGFPA